MKPRALWIGGVALRAAALVAVVSATPVAWGHKAHLFAVGEGKRISGYAYFAGGARVRRMPVKVFTGDGRLLGETMTNEKGEFHFDVPGPAEYRLVLETTDGHRAETTVPAGDFAPAGGGEAGGASGASLEQDGRRTGALSSRTPPSPEAALQEAELEKVVDRCLSRRLRTFEERLDRYEQTVRLHDVIGGIGYIFGIFGVLALVGSKRARSTSALPQDDGRRSRPG